MPEDTIKKYPKKPPLTREAVIEDIRRVAATVDLSRGFTLRVYKQNHGLYNSKSLFQIDTWKTLCQEAGLTCSPGGRNPAIIRRLLKLPVRRIFEGTLLDNKLYNDNLEKPDKSKSGLRRIMKSKPKGKPKESRHYQLINSVERCDIIADIRDIAMQIGLRSPELLKWDLYRQRGGQYHFDTVLQHGGFETLRKEAA